MFSSLLFLMIILLLAAATPSIPPQLTDPTPLSAFIQGFAVYLVTFLVIGIQNTMGTNRQFTRRTLILLANCELVGAAVLFQFYFRAYQLFAEGPPVLASITFLTLFLLLLYCTGLTVFYLTSHRSHEFHCDHAIEQLRLLIPFAFPFLFFCLITDLSGLLPPMPSLAELGTLGQTVLFLLFASLFFCLVLVFLPPLTVQIWQCKPMEPGALRERLEALCVRTHFRQGGILIWTVMRGAMTAAIIGIFPHYRYVMFTRGLLNRLSVNGVEAVLAHEIGHNRYKHLLLYPFIILGILPSLGLFDRWISPLIVDALTTHDWIQLGPLVSFITTAAVLFLYLRFVFGYFSRLFERQADLFVFEAGIAPEEMIAALDTVAIHSGHIHNQPSWHHHSIQERIDLLTGAAKDSKVIRHHHRHVRIALVVYMGMLITAFALMLL